MTFEEIIREKIENLSVGQKKTALYLSANKGEASYDTLAKLSQKIGVSETTIIRTAFSLGFDSFSDMQRKMQEEMLAEATVYERERDAENSCQSIINREIAGLKELARNLKEDKLEAAAEHIWQADQVLVAGARGSLGVGIWFSDTLEHLRSNVYTLKVNTEEGIGRLLDVTVNTVLLCVSMSRYSKASVEAVREAKKRGARIILITDNPVSPATSFADDIFVVKTFKNELGFNSYVDVFCIENMLIAAIRKNHSKELAERIKYYEEFYRNINIFYE